MRASAEDTSQTGAYMAGVTKENRTATSDAERKTARDIDITSTPAVRTASSATPDTGESQRGQSPDAGWMDRVRERAGEQLTNQKNRATEGIGTIAHAVRNTTQELREHQHETMAEYVTSAADQLERRRRGSARRHAWHGRAGNGEGERADGRGSRDRHRTGAGGGERRRDSRQGGGGRCGDTRGCRRLDSRNCRMKTADHAVSRFPISRSAAAAGLSRDTVPPSEACRWPSA